MSMVPEVQQAVQTRRITRCAPRGPISIDPVSAQTTPRRVRSSVATHVAWVASVSILGLAWLVPGTALSAGLGWIAALVMAYAICSGRSLLASYAAGLAGHVIGFHWVYGTVLVFGGLGVAGALLVFALFAGVGALQFLAIAMIADRLHRVFDALAVRSATAVVLAELLMPRLFPWHFGHTQLAFTPFVQIAGLAGAMTVSFVVFWVAEAAVRFAILGERRAVLLVPFIALVTAMLYGLTVIDHFGPTHGEPQDVVIAQGAVDDPAKRDIVTAFAYMARLGELSRRDSHQGTLIIWPEGAVPRYLPAAIGEVGNPPRLPWLGDGSAFLVGAYGYTPGERKFNTAFAVYPDGAVPFPYFKRALIPFGEYMPLASWVPWLARINAKAGVFTAGEEARVFEYPMQRPDGTRYTLKVAPLICYEDTLPWLARESTRKDAELLVNISSDAWFGRTLAPEQHHVIAAFRAIENRRFLIRSTTTGLSAIVDPLGRTIARIPPFAEGTITATVRLVKDASPYTRWVGDRPWWILLALCAGLMIKIRPKP